MVILCLYQVPGIDLAKQLQNIDQNVEVWKKQMADEAKADQKPAAANPETKEEPNANKQGDATPPPPP